MPRYIDNKTRQEILSAVHMTHQEENIVNILRGIPKADDAPALSPRLVAKMDKMIEKTFPNDANEDDDVSLTITCTMQKDCMRKFLSFLVRIEYDGSIGHSEVIAFDADGDGTFRPKFVADALGGVDEAPVVHAHWIGTEYDGYADGNPVFDSYACSNCSQEIDTDGYEPNFDYCPFCGAKMDGKESVK